MGLSAGEMQEAVIQNLQTKTGKTLEEWIQIAKSFPSQKPKDIRHQLKTEYQMGHVQAQTIVWRMDGEMPYVETDGYEEMVFPSPKIFKIYQAWKAWVKKLSPNVSSKPCRTYSPFYAKTQFAILFEKKGELVLGLNLHEESFPELETAKKLGGSNRINKQVILKSAHFQHIEKAVLEAIRRNS